MSIGKVFGLSDLREAQPPEIMQGAEGETDWLANLDKIVTDIDGLFTHLIDIQKKYPGVIDKWKGLEGKKGSKEEEQQGTEHHSIDPNKLYAVLLGFVHQFEGKNMSVEDVKKTLMDQKSFVMTQCQRIAEELEK